MRFIDRAGIVDSVEPADPQAVEAASLAGALGEHPAALVSIEGTADHLLLWSGLACTTTTAIVVESTATLIAISPDPVSDCDLAPVHRGVVMTFKAAATANSIRVVLDPDPITEPLAATLAGRLTSVEFPSEWRLAVRVCPEAIVDCDLWLYPLSNGTFLADGLAPGRYTVAAFIETRNGVIPLNSADATLVAGQTTVVELVVAALPSYPAT